jgi:hypothetical protein
MNTILITTISRSVQPIAAMIVVVALTTTGGNLAAATTDIPPWKQCAYRDYPVAADAGAVLPWNAEVSDDLRAVLLGEAGVGTDCSIYDLPV